MSTSPRHADRRHRNRQGDNSCGRWRRRAGRARPDTRGSVDERRRSAPSRYFGRVDTQRGPTPVDMRVEVDQPGHDQQPPHIDDLATAGGKVTPDLSYLSVAEGNVGRLVAPARRVNNAAASEDQIRHMRVSDRGGWWHRSTIPAFENAGEDDASGSPLRSFATGSRKPPTSGDFVVVDGF